MVRKKRNSSNIDTKKTILIFSYVLFIVSHIMLMVKGIELQEYISVYLLMYPFVYSIHLYTAAVSIMKSKLSTPIKAMSGIAIALSIYFILDINIAFILRNEEPIARGLFGTYLAFIIGTIVAIEILAIPWLVKGIKKHQRSNKRKSKKTNPTNLKQEKNKGLA